MNEKNYHHGDLKNALIRAGIEILTQEGVGGLSLRKAARKAGVSHAAPYAHFADKQSLIAAISAEGHRRIWERLTAVLTQYADNPARLLSKAAWAYVSFGLEFPDYYKVTFSGTLENEHLYPEFMEYSQRNIQLLKTIIEKCRSAGILQTEEIDSEIQAISLWGQLHGLVSLIIQGQIPSELLASVQPQEMLLVALRQIVCIPMSREMLG